MTSWVHADVLDNGPQYIKDNCNAVLLLKSYSAGDSYATVNGAGVKVAEATMAGTDFTLSNGTPTNSRKITAATSGKTDVALIDTTNGVDDLHLAFVDTLNSKVLWVTQESTDQSITTGNTVNFPTTGPVYTRTQPTDA